MSGVLLQTAAGVVWAWTGLEVTAAEDLTRVADLARLDPPARLDHAVGQQRNHLERLLSLDPGEVVAMKTTTDGTGRVRVFLLGRTFAPDETGARRRAARLVSRLGETAPHVRIARLETPHDVHAALLPFDTATDGVAQIGKRTRVVAATRPDARVSWYVGVEPFSRQIVDQTPLIAVFDAARTPVSLTVTLSPATVTTALRRSLEQESVRLAHVGKPWETTAELGGRVQFPADAAATVLEPVVADALDRYIGTVFRFGVTLSSPVALDPVLVEAVAAVLSPRSGHRETRTAEAVVSGYVVHRPPGAAQSRVVADGAGGLEPIAVPDPGRERALAADADPVRHGLAELAGIVDAAEASSLFRLPLAVDGTLPGFPVRAPADRARVVAPVDERTSLSIGHQDGGAGPEVRIPVAELSRHAFVVGTPGSGKTNTALHLCTELWARRVPFLVLEPVNSAMDDYRWLATRPGFEDLVVLTVGDESVAPLRLNPFEVPPGVRVSAHVSGLLACFEAAFGLWDPLPFLYNRALRQTYRRRGFHPDVVATPAMRGGWPTLPEFVDELGEVTEAQEFEGEVAGNIRAAGRLRAEALAEGVCGPALDTRRSHDIGALLGRPVVVELAAVGDNAKEQALVTLLLLNAIRAHRRVAAGASQHVVLLEEAHRVFPRARPGSSGEAKEADARALAAERLAQGLAEDRKYDQGYVLIDQQVGAVAEDAYKITNLKVMHRTAAEEDRRLLGSTMSMSDDQTRSAASLTPFEAIVSHNGLDRAVTVRLPDVRARDARERGVVTAPLADDDELRRRHRALVTDPDFAEAMAPYDACGRCASRCAFRRRSQSVMSDPDASRKIVEASADGDWPAVRAALAEVAEDPTGPSAVDEMTCLYVHAFRVAYPPGRWDDDDRRSAVGFAEDVRTDLERATRDEW